MRTMLKIAAGFFGIVFLVGCLLYGLIVSGYIGFSPDDEHVRVTTEIVLRKKAIAVDRGPHALFVLGGSSAFGISAQQMESALGIPVRNLAIHAGLGLKYLFFLAREQLQPGDSVLLSLEYMHYVLEKESTLEWGPLVSFQSSPEYVRELSYLEQIKYIAELFVSEERGAFTWRPSNPSQSAIEEKTPYINQWGDFVFDPNTTIDPKELNQSIHSFRRFYVNAMTSLLQNKTTIESRSGAKLIVDFVKWCKHHGVTVLMVFPSSAKFSDNEDVVVDKVGKMILSFYDNIDVKTLVNIHSSQFRNIFLFNTFYHLNEKGRNVWTDLIIKSILSRDLHKLNSSSLNDTKIYCKVADGNL
ncbi:hypothetical protein [Desulfovibrio inopinatus]|uniref:hypothetical protein n=1 Tax=Desulfovibrio inopinatus TaxID=102109 RepID=UPI0004255193|nr:hypothetical protein [Desulfovibrio inopinatus]